MTDPLSTRAARLLEIRQRVDSLYYLDAAEVDVPWLLAELTAAEARAEWQPLLREALVVVEAHGEEYSVGDLDERIRAFLAAAPEETR